ncbi:MAG: hypothetical protein RJA91_119 [Pseudomonadota bacterium]
MTWHDLTLWQYQQLIPLISKPDPSLSELESDIKKIIILKGMTEHQVDSLSIDQLKKLRQEIKFIETDIPKIPAEKHVQVNGKRYRFIYDIKSMPCARYIESKVFSQDHVANMHKISASMVMPQKKTLLGWKDDKYDASKHEEYANDLAMAKFLPIYYHMVFFYHLYRNWIEVSRDYMVEQLMTANLTKDQATQVVTTLCESMDGTIVPNLLPSSKISLLSQYLK